MHDSQRLCDKTSIASVTGNPSLDYAPGQPNLYKMMCLKQSFFAQHGLENGYQHFAESVTCVGRGGLKQIPIRSERDFAGALAIELIELARAGEPYELCPPLVIGQSNHRALHGKSRSQYAACIADARVRGRSAAILAGGALLLDFQNDEPNRLDDELEWDPAIFHAEEGHAWLIPAPDQDTPLEIEEALSLLGAHTDFFGHWIYEYLPKYVTAVLSGRLAANVPVLIDSHMPATHRQSLELLFGKDLPVIEVPAFAEVSVRRLWCAPSIMYMPLHEKQNERFSWDAVSPSPERFSLIIQEMSRRADAALTTPESPKRRIFLARKAFRHRKLLNHERIEAEARSYGFEIVYPEDYTFAEQVTLLRNAHSIIAAEGSAIFLTFFASPGTKLCILSHPITHALAIYNGILARREVEVKVLTGPMIRMNQQTPQDSDYEIVPDHLKTLIEQWLALPTCSE